MKLSKRPTGRELRIETSVEALFLFFGGFKALNDRWSGQRGLRFPLLPRREAVIGGDRRLGVEGPLGGWPVTLEKKVPFGGRRRSRGVSHCILHSEGPDAVRREPSAVSAPRLVSAAVLVPCDRLIGQPPEAVIVSMETEQGKDKQDIADSFFAACPTVVDFSESDLGGERPTDVNFRPAHGFLTEPLLCVRPAAVRYGSGSFCHPAGRCVQCYPRAPRGKRGKTEISNCGGTGPCHPTSNERK